MPNISEIQEDLIERANTLSTDDNGSVMKDDVEDMISKAYTPDEGTYADHSLNAKLCREELEVAVDILFEEQDVVSPDDVVECINDVV